MSLAIVLTRPVPLDAVLQVLSKLWWVLPFSASAGSFVVLVAIAGRHAWGDKKQTVDPTGPYLVSGPSFAALNLAAYLSLGASPPIWVGYLMMVLLFSSALIFYRSSRDPGHEIGANPEQVPAFWTEPPNEPLGNGSTSA